MEIAPPQPIAQICWKQRYFQAKRELAAAQASEAKACAFAGRIEREDSRFQTMCGEQLEAISQLDLGKTIHENLSQAVERVLNERNALLAEKTGIPSTGKPNSNP